MKEYAITLFRNIPTEVFEGMLSALCLGIVIFIAFYGLKCGWRKIAGLALAEYVFLIFCSTVIFRTAADGGGHDFTPFWSYAAIQDGRTELLTENMMNIAVFVPVGLFAGMAISQIKWWLVLATGCLISVVIETFQFMLRCGFSETDDVMHNTLGCMIGYILVLGSRFMVKGSQNP